MSQNLWASDADSQFKDLLSLKSSPNGGVAVTDDLKYTVGSSFEKDSIRLIVCAVKFSRQNGIHVSPTVLWDGLVANEISSGWGEKEWNSFLEAKVVV